MMDILIQQAINNEVIHRLEQYPFFFKAAEDHIPGYSVPLAPGGFYCDVRPAVASGVWHVPHPYWWRIDYFDDYAIISKHQTYQGTSVVPPKRSTPYTGQGGSYAFGLPYSSPSQKVSTHHVSLPVGYGFYGNAAASEDNFYYSDPFFFDKIVSYFDDQLPMD